VVTGARAMKEGCGGSGLLRENDDGWNSHER
jgi:hypothetical protein